MNYDASEAQKVNAVNWIAAHKKCFHTNQPLPQHRKPSMSTQPDPKSTCFGFFCLPQRSPRSKRPVESAAAILHRI